MWLVKNLKLHSSASDRYTEILIVERLGSDARARGIRFEIVILLPSSQIRMPMSISLLYFIRAHRIIYVMYMCVCVSCIIAEYWISGIKILYDSVLGVLYFRHDQSSLSAYTAAVSADTHKHTYTRKYVYYICVCFSQKGSKHSNRRRASGAMGKMTRFVH